MRVHSVFVINSDTLPLENVSLTCAIIVKASLMATSTSQIIFEAHELKDLNSSRPLVLPTLAHSNLSMHV